VGNVLGLKEGLMARYLKIFVTFFLSGTCISHINSLKECLQRRIVPDKNHLVVECPRKSQAFGISNLNLHNQLTLTLPGVVHYIADLTAGHKFSQYGAMKFYCIQFLGIIIEDSTQQIYRVLGGKPGSIWTRIVGYIWVVAFLLFWSCPIWFWPQVYQAGIRTEEEKRVYGKLAPFPVFGRLLG
jgi:hypothetical protein